MAQVKKSCRRLLVVLVMALLVGATGSAVAQDEPDLRISAIDLADFPTVGVRLLTRDAASAPITDLSGLVLRENRAPIPDFELARVPTGVDLVLVLDANDTILQTDETDGPTRLDKVAASVEQYARQFMNPAGLDRVTVIAPDESGSGVTILGEDIASPQELAQVVAAYQPAAPPRVTPLNDMLIAALDHLAERRDDGRFQSILLFTDGARLDQQLAYQDLARAAQTGGVPFFGAILGATADPNEVASLERLAGPTRGQVAHMPEPTALDGFYRLFQSQGQQTEARYRSLVRRGGEVEVSAALGNVRASAPFTLTLIQPELSLAIPNATIRRAGSAIDTPLPLLQPAIVPLTATLTWPDGIRRDLTEFAFLVNGRRQPLPATTVPDDAGAIPLVWDISNADAGAYELQVLARDVLGYEMSSPPQTVAITVDRPVPNTPTPRPTVVPVPSLSLPVDMDLNHPIMWLLPILFAAVVVGGWLAIRRARARRASRDPGDRPDQAAPVPATTPADDRHVAILERLPAGGAALERTVLTARDTLIGRDPEYATLVVDDPTVARLHARLRQTDDAAYWLYDEGSASGTFLNHVRLGLAPRQVQHGDHVQFGRVAFRFTLQLPPEAPPVPPPDPPAAGPPETPETVALAGNESPAPSAATGAEDDLPPTGVAATSEDDKGEDPS